MQSSVAHKLFVFLLVALQDFFDGAEHPLEGISFDANYLRFCDAFHSCLSRGVSNQGDFSKIVPTFELINLLLSLHGH